MRSRRSFLASAGALGAASLFGGCGLPFGDQRSLAGSSSLRVVNWPLYIDPSTLPVIESSIGARISYDEIYFDNVSGFDEIIEPQLAGGGVPNFDLIMPTYWLAGRLIERGWVEPLPLEAIPNHVNIDPAYLTNDWDRGSRFQMPWQAGITGIAYNPALTGGEITSIAQLLDPELSGRVGLVGEMREAVGFGMLFLGEDPSRPTPESARAGLKVITDAVERGHFSKMVFDDFVEFLSDGSLAATMAWSGQAVALQLEQPQFEYVIPDEGGISWFDTMVIPRHAENYAAAAAWMNWAYDPANAAEISLFNLYVSPVLGTSDALRARGGADAELADNPFIFPDNNTRNQLFTWGTLDLETELEIEAEFDSLFDFFE